MKKCVLILLALITVLSACQFVPNSSLPEASKPETSQPIQNQGDQQLIPPPVTIDLFGLDDFVLVHEAVNSGDENTIAQFLGNQYMDLDNEQNLIRFLEVLEALPLLQIWGDKEISISYRLGKTIKADENGNFYETEQLLETVDISFDIDDLSWVSITYQVSENGSPAKDTVDISKQQNFSLRGPLQLINNRFVVYNETSSQYSSGNGDVIRSRGWQAILDGIPVSVVYRTKNSEMNIDTVMAETFFENAAITEITHFTSAEENRTEGSSS